jgi:hypothetical protein
MVNAKNWLAGLAIDKNTVTEIYGKSDGTKSALRETLEGDLEIKGFPSLEKLVLTDVRELDKLEIGDCPKLKEVVVNNSGVKELEFGAELNSVKRLNCSFEVDSTDRPIPRGLARVDLKNVPNLQIIICVGDQKTEFENVQELNNFYHYSGGSVIDDPTTASLPTKLFRK